MFAKLHKKVHDDCDAAGIFGCNSGLDTHAAPTSTKFVEINGWKVLGNGEAIPPDAHKF